MNSRISAVFDSTINYYSKYFKNKINIALYCYTKPVYLVHINYR